MPCKQKHIEKSIIDEALLSIDDDTYLTALKNEMTMKNRSIHETNIFRRKARLFQFAAGRGFETDLVYRIIDEIVG